MKYICSNCGNLQNVIGHSGGCAGCFWLEALFITIVIAIFFPVAWIVIGFEILFLILTAGKVNYCYKCKAKDCMMPTTTPKGEKLFNEYYEYEKGKNTDNQPETTNTTENEHSVIKIKIKNTKTWFEILIENRSKIIIAGILIWIITLVCILLIPLIISDDKEDINRTSTNQKIEIVEEAKTTQSIQEQTETLETSLKLQAQYKTEIEKAINNGVIKAKKEIEQNYKEADELYLHIIDDEDYTEENYTKYESYTRAVESPIFWLYLDLIKITEKYTKQHKDLATGYYGTLADYVEPIMKKYHVSNLNKLTEIEADMAHKSNEIDIRAQGIYKMIYDNN